MRKRVGETKEQVVEEDRYEVKREFPRFGEEQRRQLRTREGVRRAEGSTSETCASGPGSSAIDADC